eukprot:2291361-Rhodomonas_salina.1
MPPIVRQHTRRHPNLGPHPDVRQTNVSGSVGNNWAFGSGGCVFGCFEDAVCSTECVGLGVCVRRKRDESELEAKTGSRGFGGSASGSLGVVPPDCRGLQSRSTCKHRTAHTGKGYID